MRTGSIVILGPRETVVRADFFHGEEPVDAKPRRCKAPSMQRLVTCGSENDEKVPCALVAALSNARMEGCRTWFQIAASPKRRKPGDHRQNTVRQRHSREPLPASRQQALISTHPIFLVQ